MLEISNLKSINRNIRTLGFIGSISFLWGCFASIYILAWLIYEKILGAPDIFLFETPNETILKEPLWKAIIFTIILGPIIETFFSQKCLYYLLSLSGWLRHHKCNIVIVGAFLFGIMHFYSLSYIIWNIITGAFFMYVYIIKRYKHGYWTVVLLHAMVNGLAIILATFE